MHCIQKCFVCCAWLWWKCARPKRHLMSIKKRSEKKVMVRKTVVNWNDVVDGGDGIIVCGRSDSTKQRKRVPNVICMRLNRLDGRWSARLQLTDCEFILFILSRLYLFFLCAVPPPTNSIFSLRLNVNTIIIRHQRVHINISFATSWFASGRATATLSTRHTTQ